MWETHGQPILKLLQIGYIKGAPASMTSLIAMQKVVGSNPISRFERDLALGRKAAVFLRPA
jgi:hypothetical protein